MDDGSILLSDILGDKLSDLGLPQTSPASALAAQILSCRRALGGFPEVPPLPADAPTPSLRSFAAAVGCAYSEEPVGDDGAARTLLLDFMAMELQALRTALAQRRREARASAEASTRSSLEDEFRGLFRALSIPPLRGEAPAERVLTQVRPRYRRRRCRARQLPRPPQGLSTPPPTPPPLPTPRSKQSCSRSLRAYRPLFLCSTRYWTRGWHRPRHWRCCATSTPPCARTTLRAGACCCNGWT